MLPAVFACYKTDGDLKKLKRDNAYLNRLIDANIEGYRAIRNAGHEILPDADKEFEDAAYRKTCFRFFKLMCATAVSYTHLDVYKRQVSHRPGFSSSLPAP